MIVVFDSGVWISALHFGGVPMKAITRGLLEDEVLTCSQIEDETIGIMRKKFQRSETSNRHRLASFLEGATRVTLTAPFPAICRDPKDDFILECASLGNADLIVTGDKDLLALATFRSTRILTPRQYLDLAQPQRAR